MERSAKARKKIGGPKVLGDGAKLRGTRKTAVGRKPDS